MPRSTRRRARRQPCASLPPQPVQGLARALLPLVAGVASTRRHVLEWVHTIGIEVLKQMLVADAEQLVGTKGKHQADRTSHHWGSTSTQLPFGGRRIRLRRPRVRSKEGEEIALPTLEELQGTDPMPERVVEQILLGVSTRGYGRSLEPLPETVEGRGTSKSAVGRKLVSTTAGKAEEYLTSRLDDVKLVAMMVDGIQVAEGTVIVALGITLDGRKVPLGLWSGSTENTEVSTSLLQDLIDRGLSIEERILAVIDGGKGLRRALQSVLGDRVLVQRCRVHKVRNVLGHLSKRRHGYVRRAMHDAYHSGSATKARKKLQSLASWLERNGEEGAAGSLREGLEETLTVLKLELSPTLTRALATTNAVENLIGTIRRVSRNVKRWRGNGMARRWSALGLMTAEKRFRRIKGHARLGELLRALRAKDTGEEEKEAA